MVSKLTCAFINPPIGGLVMAEKIKSQNKITVDWGKESIIFFGNISLNCVTNNDILRALARLSNIKYELYGKTPIDRTQIDHWLTFSLTTSNDILASITYLNKCLAPSTYLVANKLTIADLAVFNEIYRNIDTIKKIFMPQNVQRWYDLITSLPEVVKVLKDLPDDAKRSDKSLAVCENDGLKEEGKFVDLPGAEMGKVVVRFPPEASGYLHIGHAKAALLNQYYQQAFQGKLIMRFDDTNPAKENVHFEQVILGDLELLQIKPDLFTHTSQYFDLMLDYCVQLITEGKAYVDDTEPGKMKEEREQRVESVNRKNSVKKNLSMWQEMLQGSASGQKCCVRAKIDMSSLNGCLRDPTIYRCKNEPHPRTGTQYKVYPTYDFACPIVDAIESVTHTLRTMEYHDRDEQFYWFIDALKLRKPYIWEYSRLNMTNTVLSKRRLTWFVEEGLVDGWDDPRMPTVRGILRRGMTVEGLKQFIVAQGASKSVVFMEWDKIWALNKKFIDPIAARYTTVEIEHVIVNVSGAKIEKISVPAHPKNANVGNKDIYLGPKIMIDYADAETLVEGENATFINWGNLIIKKIQRKDGRITSVDAALNLDNKDFKKTVKLTWLAKTKSTDYPPTFCVYFDHIISKPVLGKDEDFKQYIGQNTRIEKKMIGDPELKKCREGDVIQLQRRGFFRVDSAYKPASQHSGVEAPIVLFYIPDGHSKDTTTNVKPKLGAETSDKKSKKSQTTVEKVANVGTNCVDGTNIEGLDHKIAEQGNIVRDLKTKKAPKEQLEKEIKVLLDCKSQYKTMTGKDWKPAQTVEKLPSSDNDGKILSSKIAQQGELVRSLKANKVEKVKIDPEIKILLDLKSQYKILTGKDWKPAQTVEKLPSSDNDEKTLSSKIAQQGELVRSLKANKAEKAKVDAEVKVLLELKSKYKELTGNDYPAAQQTSKKELTPKTTVSKNKSLKEPKTGSTATTLKKVTRLGLEARKDGDLASWYSQVITKAEMIEYYDVSGCYILRHWSFAIWKFIKTWFDAEITKLGVQEAYFPLFVSKAALEREKSHIADFAPEVAWVTKSGESDLAEPIAVRPTSETVMYPAYAKWVQSYRDLPIRLNQWNNVVRWEFKHPQPFLRTREFLWQEGHTAFATKQEAADEVLQILDLYRAVYEDLLAIPVIKGRKTEKEKFAGGDYTTTVEAFISASGRGIQGATSHFLGQNFSKMFEIIFEDPETQIKQFVYQNSWGITTRTIGVMVMVHGDNKGIVLPPRVACTQAILVPCGITANTSENERKNLQSSCEKLADVIKATGVRIDCDYRDNYSPGWKYNHWELKGVPIRIELGPKDVLAQQVVCVRRDTGEKIIISMKDVEKKIPELLETIQQAMYNRALEDLKNHLKIAKTWSDFTKFLDEKNLIISPFCGGVDCEERIKAESAREEADAETGPAMGAKSLCIPFEQPAKLEDTDKCIHPNCTTKPQFYTLFGRSY